MTASLFLLPNGTFFIELGVFLVVLWFLAKKAVPKINTALEARQELIRTSLEAANSAMEEAAQADDARRQLLEEARTQARDIVVTATKTSDQVLADMHAKGQAEYDRVVPLSAGEVAMARQRAVEEAAQRMGEIVLDVVEKIVGREVDAAAHRDLIDAAIATLRAEANAGTSA